MHEGGDRLMNANSIPPGQHLAHFPHSVGFAVKEA